MTTYSVEEIASLTGNNKETIRNWIREGKLKAKISSKKGGYHVEKKDLINFLNSMPKFALLASRLANSIPSKVSIPLTVIVALIVSGSIAAKEVIANATKENDVGILLSDLIDTMEEEINTRRKTIKDNKELIETLKKRNNEIQQEISKYENSILEIKTELQTNIRN